ncbi:MAG TPA: hypothetical protein VE172_19335 [Stackebrandtia sp.]|jgi:hypothetical protein|uniref:RICIN domain-containing protein n=1 Tax=Stackebrandtia sp. TaxID=2023065 RepID=UPI002D4CBF51|nr:hypothetical protein [Stackebrandtia sp.]HZE40958.1 hypothetical protein [Stackebrandtia sp.]
MSGTDSPAAPHGGPDSLIDLSRPEPERPHRSPQRWLLVVGAIVAAIGVAIAVAAFVTPDQRGDKPAAVPDPPPSGRYYIKAVHSGLCLGIGPEIKNDRPTPKRVLVQDKCSKAKPVMGLTNDNGVYRINAYDPAQGTDCIRADKADAHGYVLTPSPCADDPRQMFFLEKTSGEYQVSFSSQQDVCVGIMNGADAPGTQALTGPCGDSGQRFTLEKR